MTAALRRRLDRLEQRRAGHGRLITIQVHERDRDRRDVVDKVLADAGVQLRPGDLVVKLLWFGPDPYQARLLNTKPMN